MCICVLRIFQQSGTGSAGYYPSVAGEVTEHVGNPAEDRGPPSNQARPWPRRATLTDCRGEKHTAGEGGRAEEQVKAVDCVLTRGSC